MERAGKLLRKLKLPAGCKLTPEETVRAAWSFAVGPAITRHSRVVALRGSRLVVEVEDVLWQQNLRGFEGDILKNLARLTGDRLAQQIQVVIGAPRMQPGRASQALRDEADAIQDPVLRHIYKGARRRAN